MSDTSVQKYYFDVILINKWATVLSSTAVSMH